MSLNSCFECKKKISNIVDARPHCGCPMNNNYIKEFK